MRTFYSALLMIGAAGCSIDESSCDDDASPELGVIESEPSDVLGCHLYVDSDYGGMMLHMGRGTTISDLHALSMGDKINSVRISGDSSGRAALRLWIDKNYRGASWHITYDVSTFHTSDWGNLGDNASSADCYLVP